jgi:hypothetical protein
MSTYYRSIYTRWQKTDGPGLVACGCAATAIDLVDPRDDLAGCAARGIKVLSTPGVNALALGLDLREQIRRQVCVAGIVRPGGLLREPARDLADHPIEDREQVRAGRHRQ